MRRRLPYAGVVGALGLATIAYPLLGSASVRDGGAAAAAAPASADGAQHTTARAGGSPVDAPVDPTAVPTVPRGVSDFRAVPSSPATPPPQVPPALAAPAELLVTRASRDGEREVLPGCDGVPAASDAPNGQLDPGDLCRLWDGEHLLRADAAVAIARLTIAYRTAFGEDLPITDSYRTLSAQQAVRRAKPRLAARPGTSEHGWALAVDLAGGIQDPGSEKYRWLRDHAPAFGWDNPAWARPGGSGPTEPWHWEYVPGAQPD